MNPNTASWHCQPDVSFPHQASGWAPVPASNTHRLLGNGVAVRVSGTADASWIFDHWVATSGSIGSAEHRGTDCKFCSRKMHFECLLPNVRSWKEEAKTQGSEHRCQLAQCSSHRPEAEIPLTPRSAGWWAAVVKVVRGRKDKRLEWACVHVLFIAANRQTASCTDLGFICAYLCTLIISKGIFSLILWVGSGSSWFFFFVFLADSGFFV